MLLVECEWLTGCLRVKDEKNLDSYVWTCTVSRIDDTLWLKGVLTMPGEDRYSMREALRRYCLAEGIRTVCWERRVGGEKRFVEWRVCDRPMQEGDSDFDELATND